MKNSVFVKKFGKLYEEIEGGVCEVFEFQHPAGEIRHVFIKRKIPTKLNGRTYYDLVTPSAYGGPVILECIRNRESELMDDFQQAFQNYCKNGMIICEVVHFHPVFSNAFDFIEIYDLVRLGNTLGTRLSSPGLFGQEYSDASKRAVADAIAKGVSFRVTAGSYIPRYYKDLYLSLETENMEINQSSQKNYIAACFELPRKNNVIVEAVYREKTIGMSLNLLCDDVLQPQLTTTLKAYDHLSPKLILHHGLADWGLKNGVKTIHNGAGAKLGEEDEVYQFKKQMGSVTFPYYAGKKIWNEEIYEVLCQKAGVGVEAAYFPGYRISDHILEEDLSINN